MRLRLGPRLAPQVQLRRMRTKSSEAIQWAADMRSISSRGQVLAGACAEHRPKPSRESTACAFLSKAFAGHGACVPYLYVCAHMRASAQGSWKRAGFWY